jgi:hypothetical protein
MICADFVAGANLENAVPATPLFSMTILQVLPTERQQKSLEALNEKAS